MKDFIKTKLRKFLLEATSASPINPIDRKEIKKTTFYDLAQFVSRYNNAMKEFGHIPYFQDAREGDGTYLVIVSKNGTINVKTPNRKIGDNEIGGVSTTRMFDNLEIPINAYSGNEEVLQVGARGQVTGKPYTSSGAADARIKAYVIFGDTIAERIRQNIEDGHDEYAEKDGTFKGKTDKQIARKDHIDQREKERAARKEKRGTTTAFDSEEDKQAYLDKQARLQAKYAKMKKRG